MPSNAPATSRAPIAPGVLTPSPHARIGPATRSPRFAVVLDQIARFAAFDRAVVLLEGEPGTGKTSLARHLHDCSLRRTRAFHRVDLGALDDALASSDLFGHVPGAFTGAQARRPGHFVSAQHGTLFLDEVGKASLATQRKLLHAIEYGELHAVGTDRPINVDVRLVAATNVSLESLVESGEFLPDLLPRFGYFRVRVPPLRERREDIGMLARDIVRAQSGHFGYDAACAPALSDELVAALEGAPWPGNVRELASALQYLLVAAGGAELITLAHCDGPLEGLRTAEADAERYRRAVRETGSIAAAARRLGVARTTVYRNLGAADAEAPVGGGGEDAAGDRAD